MNQDTSRGSGSSRIRRALRTISVGSYVFQCQVASRLGLHHTDLHAIHRLGLAPGGLSVGGLGEQLGLTSGATTTAIDRLVAMGFAERRSDPNDGRRTQVRLRPSASKRLRGQYRQIDELVDAAIAELDDAELATIARFLERIANGPA